jgi:hypothetical protein
MKRVRGEGGKFNSNDAKRSDSADLSDGYEMEQKPSIAMSSGNSHHQQQQHHSYQVSMIENFFSSLTSRQNKQERLSLSFST